MLCKVRIQMLIELATTMSISWVRIVAPDWVSTSLLIPARGQQRLQLISPYTIRDGMEFSYHHRKAMTPYTYIFKLTQHCSDDLLIKHKGISPHS
jgi:hypothetical protein